MSVLTPEVVSATAAAPPAVPLGPTFTTSLRALPPDGFPATRRPLPLETCAWFVAVFSFVLDVSDLESSTWGLDLGGAMGDLCVQMVRRFDTENGLRNEG